MSDSRGASATGPSTAPRSTAPPSTAPEGALAELDHALRTGDASAARRHTRAVTSGGAYDDALALLARCGRDDPLAAELLIEALDASGTVRRFAQAALLDHAAAEDVSQDALISIADSLDAFAGRGKVTTWVHTIVRRRVVDHLRRQRQTAPLPEDEASPAARMSSMIATRESVQQALAELDELYREPVTLRDIEGWTYAEIAARLDRAEGTVKAQISRGRAMVAAKLGDDGGIG